MAENRSFYQDLTEIGESRITELIRQAEQWEAREPAFPDQAPIFVRVLLLSICPGVMSQTDYTPRMT
jgi:hypothetical protein